MGTQRKFCIESVGGSFAKLMYGTVLSHLCQGPYGRLWKNHSNILLFIYLYLYIIAAFHSFQTEQRNSVS